VTADPQAVVAALLERHGRTFADELGIDLASPGPPELFRLVCFALLSSARISADLARRGTRALTDAGWSTAQAMAEASWEDRARVLNQSGYARYDERTSTMLGQSSDLLLERYDGDLAQLREAAERKPRREKALLQELSGIGPVGADIFLREAQACWEELRPYLDRRARNAAGALGLPRDPGELAELAPDGNVARLVAALIRTSLAKDTDEITAAASGSADR